MYADDLPAAAAHLDAAVALGGKAGLPMAHLLEAELSRVLVAYRHGDWDLAAADGERLVTQAAARQPGAAAGALAIELADARATIAVARDDPEGVLAAVQGVIGDLDRLSGLEPGMLSFWPACAQALARTSRPDQAEVILGRFEALARMRGRRSALAAAARARGVIQAARNRPADALAAFDASLRHLDGLGMPLEEAMTRLERGRLLRRTGQRRSATRDLGAARGMFTGLGAQPFLARCDQELCAGPRAAAGPALPLTARQLTVAQAAAAGKSNRQIAAELYISVKTVEFHLAQILDRLGVDTRTQIGDALAAAPQAPVHAHGQRRTFTAQAPEAAARVSPNPPAITGPLRHHNPGSHS